MLKAAIAHRGTVMLDGVSPCVTFNDHEGSTKSYAFTRENSVEVVQADFIEPARAITADYQAGALSKVMMHDGSWVRLRKVTEDYDPTDRDHSYRHIRSRRKAGEIVTGLLYISTDSKDMHEQMGTTAGPLNELPFEQLCPGSAELEKLQQRFR
jgi:2-oxoglutarate ferredoxin oxidoreductase subunit beta